MEQIYTCRCHVGRCLLHEVENPARDRFIKYLLKKPGLDKVKYENDIEKYDGHTPARILLHAVDDYVNCVINQLIENGVLSKKEV